MGVAEMQTIIAAKAHWGKSKVDEPIPNVADRQIQVEPDFQVESDLKSVTARLNAMQTGHARLADMPSPAPFAIA